VSEFRVFPVAAGFKQLTEKIGFLDESHSVSSAVEAQVEML
jgi:hypothetical protein